MSSLLKITTENSEKTNTIIITVIDIHDCAGNVQMISDDQGSMGFDENITYFMMCLLLDGSDFIHLKIPDFYKECKRMIHQIDHGTVEGFNEKGNYDFVDDPNPTHDEVIEHFIESTKIIELRPNDFWENYTGGDYSEEDLPYVKVEVTLKDEKWVKAFAGRWWETPFDITQ